MKYSTSRYLCDALTGHWGLACFYARSCLAAKEALIQGSAAITENEYRKETENLVSHVQHCNLPENEGNLLSDLPGWREVSVKTIDLKTDFVGNYNTEF